ncbi:MAG TPA: hypothetical protein VM733_21205 [Thermoanaerobaculia bacterium]|nr:hypothetical protein [Thermoanaerobaculia bacterium]
MTLHRIEHAIVMDTDDVPGRGGYAVVGISPRVSPAERSFIASNFGISDYLHDPRTEPRIFYSAFRIPGSERRAFVRRFARGNELRRNNTQRRLIVHTLLLDESVWNELHALPWLLLNANVRLEGETQWSRLRAESPWSDDGTTLPALEWDSEDGAGANAWKRVTDRLALMNQEQPHELLARMITALSQRPRITLPQDPGREWATMLAWSMLPRRDRDELAWTQHDSMNLSGISFAIANAPGGDFDPSQIQPAAFAHELVQMNVASDASWLDLQRRTKEHPLSIRNAADLHEWGKWRNALLDLQRHIHDADAGDRMTALARAAKNPRAGWIDAEEVLRLVWTNVSSEVAATQWGQRLRESGLAKIVFAAVPLQSWLAEAAKNVGADALIWFFLSGGGEDESASGTRTALAEWIAGARPRLSSERIAQLAYLLAKDGSHALKPLLEVLLESRDGLTALTRALGRHASGDVELMHAAAPIVVQRASAKALAFLRDVFVPRFDPKRLDVALARPIASALREDSGAVAAFLRRLPAAVAGPVAIGLAQSGEPAGVWLDVLLRMARPIDEANDTNAAGDFAKMVRELSARHPNLDGAMPLLIDFIRGNPRAREAIRAIVLLLRPVWRSDPHFPRALVSLLKRAPNVIAWEDVVVAYADDESGDVSELAAEWWMLIDPAVATRSASLIDRVQGEPRQRLVAYWKDRLNELKPSAGTDKLLGLVQHTSKSYDVERDLAARDIRLGNADVQTLNRLEAALHRLHGPNSTRKFRDELDVFLGEGKVTRAARALKLLASDDCHPTVKVVLLQSVLPDVLLSLRGRDWEEVRAQTRDGELLSPGVVPRLAYALGARATRRAIDECEAVWKRSGRRDALEALQAGRATRGPLQWLARRMRMADAPISM